jgi:DNA polymerase-1
MKQDKFVIIDAPAILHRAWHALPKLTDRMGRVINAVYGFTSVFLKILRELQPTYLAACFDTAAPTFRHKIYKEYKATRKPQPQEFYDQIPLVKEALKAFNVPIFEKNGYEADDLIGVLSQCKKENSETIIVTGDLDTLQLVDKKTKVYFLRQGISGVKIYDENLIRQKYGLEPYQLVDFKALRGDPSDNITGVKGIGKKTATELIQRFGSLEGIYQFLENSHTANSSEIKPGVKKLLIEQKEQAFLSKKLLTILKEKPKDLVVEIGVWPGPNLDEVEEIFKNLGFKSLLERLKKVEVNPRQETIF